jgi:hypothetical protein
MKEKKDSIPQETLENIRLEYGTLRTEIIQRISLRQQLLSITLTITGVILSFGVSNGAIALILPPLILFLVNAWTQNDIRARDAAIHIRENIEPHLPGLEWETSVQKDRESNKNIKWRRTIFSYGGVFVFAQLIAIGLGLIQYNYSILEATLIGISIFSIILTMTTLRAARRW